MKNRGEEGRAFDVALRSEGGEMGMKGIRKGKGRKECRCCTGRASQVWTSQ
jgi:hypothetical protein